MPDRDRAQWQGRRDAHLRTRRAGRRRPSRHQRHALHHLLLHQGDSISGGVAADRRGQARRARARGRYRSRVRHQRQGRDHGRTTVPAHRGLSQRAVCTERMERSRQTAGALCQMASGVSTGQPLFLPSDRRLLGDRRDNRASRRDGLPPVRARAYRAAARLARDVPRTSRRSSIIASPTSSTSARRSRPRSCASWASRRCPRRKWSRR